VQKLDLIAAHYSESGLRATIELIADSSLVVTVQFTDSSLHLRLLSHDVVKDIAYTVAHVAFIILSLFDYFRWLNCVVVSLSEEVLNIFIRVRN
jgi:hypothetical protein